MTEALVPHTVEPDAVSAHAGPRRRIGSAASLTSDIFYSFRRSKLTMVAAAITLLFFLLAIFASVLAVQNPFDPAQLQLMNSRIAAAVDSGRPEPVPARHRRTGPRCVFRHSLWPAHFPDRRRARRGARRHARHHAWADRRLCRRRGRWPDHAHRRRAADLPRHPDRASDQWRGQVGDRQPARCHEHAGRAGIRDRLEFLGAICAHRARLGDGGKEQGLCRGRAADRACRRR